MKVFRYIFILFISFLFSQNSLTSQNLETSYLFAKDRIQMGQYHEAIETLQRVIYFDKEKTYKDAYQSLAQCYHATQNFDQAVRYYDIAYYLTDNDSLKYEMSFNKTNCLLQQGQLKYALIELYNLPAELPHYFKNKKHFYMGIVEFGQENFEAAKENFLYLVKDNPKATAAIEDLFVKNEKVSRLNPQLAQWLSVFIPGLGQMYAGDFSAGINSLLINVAFYTLFISVAFSATFWEALLFVFPWFQRYYSGGIKSAKRITIQKQAEKHSKVYKKILKELEKAQLSTR